MRPKSSPQLAVAGARPFTKLLILGGGAVVRECFLPAVASLGLLDRTAVVDPRCTAASFSMPAEIISEDFGRFFVSGGAAGMSHCIVALPNALHVQAVTLTLEAGLDVLCEKPLALRRTQCEELAGLAERLGRVLAVNMVRRRF